MTQSQCLGQTVWAFALVGHASKALFDAIAARRKEGSSPNVMSFNAAISACEKNGLWLRVAPLLNEMWRERLTPVEIRFNTAITSCEKGGQWQFAAMMHDETRGESLRSDVISFNAAISTCEENGQWQYLAALIVEMCKDLTPD
eukprot:6109456-Karenia_brevis.AAC.1